MPIKIIGSRKNPAPPPKPPSFSAPPKNPPKDWQKKQKFNDLLDRQNPMMSLTVKEILTHTRTPQDQKKKDEDDDAKKKARVAAIIAANKAKRKGVGKTSNVSGTGTVTPILYSYPSGGTDQTTTSTGFSWSDIPSIVWIILAVAGGLFLIKSARKR